MSTTQTPAPQKKGYKPKTLTTEEKETQRVRANILRQVFTEACREFVADMPPKDRDKVGLMISGGVDSAILLWTLLDIGIRPYLYSFHMHTAPRISQDELKARKFAEKYDLPLRIVQLTQDPDELVNTIVEMNSRYRMARRADFEVLPTWRAMMIAARDEDDVKYMFCGTGDGMLYQLGRKAEVKYSEGRLSLQEQNFTRIESVDANQDVELIRMGTDLGVRVCLPYKAVTSAQIFNDLPWHIINRPGKKDAALVAYEKEIKESGIKPVTNPLQCGDSGSREYYDTLVPASKISLEITGRDSLKTSGPLYNALRKQGVYEASDPWAERHTKYRLEWLSYVTEGIPLSDKAKEFFSEYIDLEKGQSFSYQDPRDTVDAEEDIFGLADNDIEDEYEEPFIDPDTGEPSIKVDCLGLPLFDSAALNGCPLALKGLCGKPLEEGVTHLVTECEIWDIAVGNAESLMERASKAYSMGDDNAYSRFGKRSIKVLEDLRGKKSEEIFNKEFKY